MSEIEQKGNIERLEVFRSKAAEMLLGRNGQQLWFWRWLEANNEKIATSGEPFYSKQDAYKAAERIETRLNYRLPIHFLEE